MKFHTRRTYLGQHVFTSRCTTGQAFGRVRLTPNEARIRRMTARWLGQQRTQPTAHVEEADFIELPHKMRLPSLV